MDCANSHNGNLYVGKAKSLYWYGSQLSSRYNFRVKARGSKPNFKVFFAIRECYIMHTCYYSTLHDWRNESHIDGLASERRDSSALAMELRVSCTNPSIWRRLTCSISQQHYWLLRETHRCLPEVKTKWTPFCRQHFRNCVLLICMKIVFQFSQGPNQYVSIGLDNDLAPIRRQTII